MTICPECHYKNKVGEFYCEQCGTPLYVARQSQSPCAESTLLPDAEAKVCPHCAHHNPPGTLHCAICKRPLPAADDTPYAGVEKLRARLDQVMDLEAPEHTRALRRPQPVIYVQGATEPLPLSTEQDNVFGRSSPASRDPPTFDLTPFNAHELGVSRRHAAITYDNNTFFLRDLHSTNGTTLNGKDLLPGIAYVLNSGDEIRFGKLVCHIYF